jgi:hypothetical protein
LHVAFVDTVAQHHTDIDPSFKKALAERGIAFSTFQTYFRDYVRNNGEKFSNVPQAVRQAKLDFMAQTRDKPMPGQTSRERLTELKGQWDSIREAFERNPQDPAAQAEWAKIQGEISTLVEHTGFKTATGEPDIDGLFTYLDRARVSRPSSAPRRNVAELLPEAQRLARLDLAQKARDGEISIEALLGHDLFVDRESSPVGGGPVRFRRQALSLIPQELIVKAFRKASGEARARLARDIFSIARELGYSEKQLEQGFPQFLMGYRGSSATVKDLAELFLRGSDRELASLLVRGDLDINVIPLLPERTATRLANAARSRVGLGVVESRAAGIVDSLTVQQVTTLIGQVKDANDLNRQNAADTLAILSNRFGVDPQFFIAFMEGYSQVREDNSIRGRIGSVLGLESDPRQARAIGQVRDSFWKEHRNEVRIALEKDPALVDGIASTGFFEKEAAFQYLPTKSLMLTPRTIRVPAENAQNGETTEATLPPNPLHEQLVVRAATDLARADANFEASLRKLEGESVFDAYLEHTRQFIIRDGASYPTLDKAVEAAKKDFLKARAASGTRTGALLLDHFRFVESRASGRFVEAV